MLGRYFYFESNGSNSNSINFYTEIQIVDKDGVNRALGRGLARYSSIHPNSKDPSVVTDGDTNTNNFFANVEGKGHIVIDLGDVYDISYIKIWRYHGDNRTFKDVFVKVSEDDVTYTTVFSSAVNGTYAEQSTGYRIDISEVHEPIENSYVSYLQSYGKQYINTGVRSTSEINYEVEYMAVNAVGNNCLIGSDGLYNSFFPCVKSKFDYIAYSCSTPVVFNTLSNSLEGVKCTIKKTGNVFELSHGDSTLTFSDSNFASFTRSYNMFLFTASSSADFSHVRIYSCKIYNGTELVRDFVPAVDGDCTPCLYDKVTESYFYNAGSGSFTVGAVISDGSEDEERIFGMAKINGVSLPISGGMAKLNGVVLPITGGMTKINGVVTPITM